MRNRPFFYQLSHNVRISVRPQFVPEQSFPDVQRYVFAYFVRIEYVGRGTVQLLARHWYIHDSNGDISEVAGAGVVGEQPVFGPGDVHEYQSFCVLKSSNGFMEGTYRFVDDAGAFFDARIPRFVLTTDETPREY
jgi:ApaG protein